MLSRLTCKCKNVALKFTTAKPLYSLECCCVDCYQKNEWAARKSGETFSKTHGSGTPLKLSYFANRFTVERGEKHIAFNRLREDSESINMVTSCCNSLLCVDYPSYEEKQVLTFPEFQPNVADSSPVARVWIKDWEEEELKKLQVLPGFYVDKKGIAHGSEAMRKIREGKRRAVTVIKDSDEKSTTTFQKLLSGNEIKTLGLQEIDSSFRLRKSNEEE